MIKKTISDEASGILGISVRFLRKFLFRVLSVGPVPQHIAFILDGNRRYARKWNLPEGAGHKFGFLALVSMLKYCFELGVKYVSIYAFSIDNLKRKPYEVKYVMDLMEEKIEGLLKQESIINQYGVRVHFIGDLRHVTKSVRAAAERLMAATAHNSRVVLGICVGYTSTDEIAHSVSESCREKWGELQLQGSNEVSQKEEFISLVDIEKNMYMAVMADTNILVRTSGETRLSNFLLWQTSYGHLYSPAALYPEIGLWHLIWATVNFQRHFAYFEKVRKTMQISQAKKDC